MNALFVAAKEVGDFMRAPKWQFCLIGGLAVQRWGEPRTTQDVGLTLLTGLGNEEAFASPLLERFQGRVADALNFALRNRVLLIRASNGRDVDISFGALEFEETMMARAEPFELAPGLILPICSAEDLFVLKAFAARPRDRIDAQGVVVRQKGHLDEGYILHHLTVLCDLKEEPEIVMRARRLLETKQWQP